MGNTFSRSRTRAVSLSKAKDSSQGRPSSTNGRPVSGAGTARAAQSWAMSRKEHTPEEHDMPKVQNEQQLCTRAGRNLASVMPELKSPTNETTARATVLSRGRSLPGEAEDTGQTTTTSTHIDSNSTRATIQLTDALQRLHTAEMRCRQLEQRNKVLETSLLEAQRQRPESSRNADRETSASRMSQTGQDGAGQTVEAQNKIIASLQGQLNTAAEELSALRERFNRRLKKQRAASAELKTEASLTIMHLREDNEELQLQNEKLKSELQAFQQRSATSPSPGAVRPETDEQVGDIHALLVAELSQQVTDLNEELSRAKRKIKKLQRPQRAPSSAGALLEGSGHMRSDSFQGQHSPFMFST